MVRKALPAPAGGKLARGGRLARASRALEHYQPQAHIRFRPAERRTSLDRLLALACDRYAAHTSPAWAEARSPQTSLLA